MKITLQFESSRPESSPPLNGSLVNSLGEIRDRLFCDGPLPNDRHPDAPHFVRRPEVQLTEYAAQRETSPLGQVFQVANGLHDHLDAVVVLGCDESILAIRAIADACCDPYHNELSRADRGSKPRLYFVGSRCDNDAIRSLLGRLVRDRSGATDAEKRFAILPVGYPDKSASVETSFPHLIDALRGVLGKQLGNQLGQWLPRLVIPIVHPQSPLSELLGDLSPAASFELSGSDDPIRDVLSPVGLLPAAFLGLDCMKLLEGAYAVTEQFRSADFQDNLVMRYVAAECRGDRESPSGRWIRNWNPALDSLGKWHRALGRAASSPEGLLSEHWNVRWARTDSLFDKRASLLHETGKPCSLDELNESAIQNATNAPEVSAIGATRLVLPQMDTHGIGQWLQLLLLGEYVLTRISAASSGSGGK